MDNEDNLSDSTRDNSQILQLNQQLEYYIVQGFNKEERMSRVKEIQEQLELLHNKTKSKGLLFESEMDQLEKWQKELESILCMCRLNKQKELQICQNKIQSDRIAIQRSQQYDQHEQEGQEMSMSQNDTIGTINRNKNDIQSYIAQEKKKCQEIEVNFLNQQGLINEVLMLLDEILLENQNNVNIRTDKLRKKRKKKQEQQEKEKRQQKEEKIEKKQEQQENQNWKLGLQSNKKNQEYYGQGQKQKTQVKKHTDKPEKKMQQTKKQARNPSQKKQRQSSSKTQNQPRSSSKSHRKDHMAIALQTVLQQQKKEKKKQEKK